MLLKIFLTYTLIYVVPCLGFYDNLLELKEELSQERKISLSSQKFSEEETAALTPPDWSTDGGEGRSLRRKRATVIWPRNSRFRTDFYISIPLLTPRFFALPYNAVTRYYMVLPNVTEKDSLADGRALQAKEEERSNLLSVVEGGLNMIGVDGHSCVLRAVCETAEHDFHIDGLLAELITIVLGVPSSSPNNIVSEHSEASLWGKEMGNCRDKYDCPFSILSEVD